MPISASYHNENTHLGQAGDRKALWSLREGQDSTGAIWFNSREHNTLRTVPYATGNWGGKLYQEGLWHLQLGLETGETLWQREWQHLQGKDRGGTAPSWNRESCSLKQTLNCDSTGIQGMHASLNSREEHQRTLRTSTFCASRHIKEGWKGYRVGKKVQSYTVALSCITLLHWDHFLICKMKAIIFKFALMNQYNYTSILYGFQSYSQKRMRRYFLDLNVVYQVPSIHLLVLQPPIHLPISFLWPTLGIHQSFLQASV